MKKLSIGSLVDFRRRKSDSTGYTVLHNSQKDKQQKPDKGGGDYWVSCLSAIRNYYNTGNKALIGEKIEKLINRIEETDNTGTKDRWQKNIEILYNFEDYDFDALKPRSGYTLLKRSDDKSILKIHDLPIESKPCFVFSFTNGDFNEIGAIWFIAKKEGFKKSELGMFCDIMHRYLFLHFADKYKVNPKYCIAVDLFKCQDVNYSQLIEGDINYLLDNTLIEVKVALAKLNYH